MFRISTSEGGTPTPNRIVELTAHSQMEMGSDLATLYHKNAKNKMTT